MGSQVCATSLFSVPMRPAWGQGSESRGAWGWEAETPTVLEMSWIWSVVERGCLRGHWALLGFGSPRQNRRTLGGERVKQAWGRIARADSPEHPPRASWSSALALWPRSRGQGRP